MNTDRKNKKSHLVLSRETVRNLAVASSIKTGVVIVNPTTNSQYCPVHTIGNQCLPPGTSHCPM